MYLCAQMCATKKYMNKIKKKQSQMKQKTGYWRIFNMGSLSCDVVFNIMGISSGVGAHANMLLSWNSEAWKNSQLLLRKVELLWQMVQ